MVRIVVNVSKEKALQHKFDKFPTKRLRYIVKHGTTMRQRVARRVLQNEAIGRKLRKKKGK